MGPIVRMPSFEFIAAPVQDNVAMLSPKTWAGTRPVLASDKFTLPVLHTPGFVNAANGAPPDTDPAPATVLGDAIWVEPTEFFGKQGTPRRTPRSMGLRLGVFTYQDFMAEDPSDLDAARVFRFYNIAGFYDGFLLKGIPFSSLDLINFPFDYLPTAELPENYIAGEFLSIVELAAGGNYDISAWSASDLLPSDITQLAAAQTAFTRMAVRMHGYAGMTAPTIAFFEGIAADCVSAGIDCTFEAGDITQARIRANYEAFFGI